MIPLKSFSGFQNILQSPKTWPLYPGLPFLALKNILATLPSAPTKSHRSLAWLALDPADPS